MTSNLYRSQTCIDPNKMCIISKLIERVLGPQKSSETECLAWPGSVCPLSWGKSVELEWQHFWTCLRLLVEETGNWLNTEKRGLLWPKWADITQLTGDLIRTKRWEQGTFPPSFWAGPWNSPVSGEMGAHASPPSDSVNYAVSFLGAPACRRQTVGLLGLHNQTSSYNKSPLLSIYKYLIGSVSQENTDKYACQMWSCRPWRRSRGRLVSTWV